MLYYLIVTIKYRSGYRSITITCFYLHFVIFHLSSQKYRKMSVRNRLVKSAIPLLLISIFCCLSFTDSNTPPTATARYYDKQTDLLLASLRKFKTAAARHKLKDSLLPYFFASRTAYKKIELFVDAFLPQKARAINGPDLLKIDEENPSDSVFQHGFQVIEALLYEDKINTVELKEEINLLIQNISLIRKDPERVYYFADHRIWHAMRLGVYRIISMGITGFDVPISYHALPETKAVLSSVQQITHYYKGIIPTAELKIGDSLYTVAQKYLTIHTDFNTFDRLTFIRQFINPISSWLTTCSVRYGFINPNGIYPLNPLASNLFAADVMNLDFFSPNADYRITAERIALGKQLFYDPILSGDGSRSCATCHKPELAFTDGLPKAKGLHNEPLLRNTPTLWNVAYQTAQFYDSRTKVLENQLSAVVHNIDEMNGSLKDCIPRLAAHPAYSKLFAAAYPTHGTTVTEYHIANAISSYMRTLISLNSRFDQYMRMQTEDYTQSEKNGFNLFMGKAKCGTCHYAPVFNGLIPPLYEETESETLAVPATSDATSTLDADEGRYDFTRQPYHRYSFKTPTVRNSALTAPYMHNGVLATLADVVDFYNDGGGYGRGISLPTQTLPTDKLNLSAQEKQDIITFLHSLTDTVYNNPKTY